MIAYLTKPIPGRSAIAVAQQESIDRQQRVGWALPALSTRTLVLLSRSRSVPEAIASSCGFEVDAIMACPFSIDKLLVIRSRSVPEAIEKGHYTTHTT